MLLIGRKSTTEEDEEEPSGDMTFYRLLLGQTPGKSKVKAELLLEKACPLEAAISPTHCDGLVAIVTATDQVFVCNPATNELVALPLGSPNVEYTKFPSGAIGFDRWRNEYVVARYFYRRRCYDESGGKLDYDIGHEIFTLGGESWELTADPPHAISGARPVYWACDEDEYPRPSSLLRFSLRHRISTWCHVLLTSATTLPSTIWRN